MSASLSPDFLLSSTIRSPKKSLEEKKDIWIIIPPSSEVALACIFSKLLSKWTSLQDSPLPDGGICSSVLAGLGMVTGVLLLMLYSYNITFVNSSLQVLFFLHEQFL